MNLQPQDIVTRADRNGEQTVWVSERLLVSLCEGLTEETLRTTFRKRYAKTVPATRRKQQIMPDTEASWRFARIDRAWYYDLDRIPDRAPRNYRSQLPEKQVLLEMHQQTLAESRPSEIETLVKKALKTDWAGYLPHYPGLREHQAAGLAKAAAVVALAYEYATRNALDFRRLDYFAELGALVTRLRIPYLPSNCRRLKEKVVRLLGGEQAWEVIQLPRQGNQSRRPYSDEQVISWILAMRNSGMNTSAAHIARRLPLVCALYEKNAPTKTWVEHYLARKDVKQLTFRRYGAHGRKAMPWRGYVPIAGAVYAGDCWMMDATRVNFIEFTEGDNKWQHLMVCMVYDVYSGAMIGRSYGTAENRWMYQDALAKAATATGYLPWEIVTDRFPGHDTHEWQAVVKKLEHAQVRVEVTYKMQGKARLERAIDTVQMIAMQHSDKYYGQGIQSSRDYAHRSEEVLGEMRKRARAEGWNRDRAIQEAEAAFELYNNTRYNEYSRALRTVDKSPMELHQESEKPHAGDQYEPYELLHYFGLQKRISIRNQGMIVTEINKVKYVYVIDPAHYDVAKHHKEVLMYYDLEDLTTVHLFTDADLPSEEQYICEATEQQAVQWHGPNKDGKAMGKAVSRIKAWSAKQQEELDRIHELAGVEVSVLMGTTAPKEARERAETAWLLERSGSLPLPAPAPDENDIDLDIRGMY